MYFKKTWKRITFQSLEVTTIGMGKFLNWTCKDDLFLYSVVCERNNPSSNALLLAQLEER